MTQRMALVVMLAACGNGSPPGVAMPPLLVVANTPEATVSILELPTGKELARLHTELGPHEVAVSPDGRRAVVSSYGDGAAAGHSLTVIDLASLAIAATIDLGTYSHPHGIAFVDARRVVVTSEDSASIVVVDLDAGSIERAISTSQQGSHMLALAPGASNVYVANFQSASITPIDLARAEADTPVPTIEFNEAIAVTPDGAEVWTASLPQNKILIFDAPQLTLDGELDASGGPLRITPTPDGTTMIVANVYASKLQLIDVATRAIATVDLPATLGDSASPVGTAVASDSKTAYVALVAEDRVAVVDLATRAVTGYLPVGRGPDGVAYRDATPGPRSAAPRAGARPREIVAEGARSPSGPGARSHRN